MATVMNMHWAEVTKDLYEAVRKDVLWEKNVPSGAKYHVAWFDGGLHVLDVWDSQRDFETFLQQRLMPSVQKLKVPGQPKVTFHDTHAIFAPNPS